MKFKIAFVVVSCFSVLNCYAQDNGAYKFEDTTAVETDSIEYIWTEVIKYEIDSEDVWTIDAIGNVFISDGGAINKYDTTGVLKFSQSIKSLGKMQQLMPVNSMKLVHFSEEQQTLCYLDNTLTQIDDCIEMSDRGIINGALVTTSSRSDMVWVYDNLNSKLILLPMEDGQQQGQEIENLAGVIGIESLSQILEKGSQLYVVDEEKGVYIFDLYGSLLEFMPLEGVKFIDVKDDILFVLMDNEIKLIMTKLDDELAIPLPKEDIREFIFSNQHFYLRTSQHVHKFTVQISK